MPEITVTEVDIAEVEFLASVAESTSIAEIENSSYSLSIDEREYTAALHE